MCIVVYFDPDAEMQSPENGRNDRYMWFRSVTSLLVLALLWTVSLHAAPLETEGSVSSPLENATESAAAPLLSRLPEPRSMPNSAHPCLNAGAVLAAIERRRKETGYIFHRYQNEAGGYRLYPFSYSSEDPEKTVFFLLTSIPWGTLRSWFLEEMHLTEFDGKCQLKQVRRYAFTPSEDLTIYQAAQVMHATWKSYLEKVIRLERGGEKDSVAKVLAWPDPLMYRPEYLALLPRVPFEKLRPGDVAYDEEGRFVIARSDAHAFNSRGKAFHAFVRTSFGWKHLDLKSSRDLDWRRPVAEYWEGRPARFNTVGGHDCDGDGLFSGMDACPCCAEDYVGECQTDGCPSGLKMEGNLKLRAQLSLGAAYVHPEAMGLLEGGVSLHHPDIGFNLAVGLLHNFTQTSYGYSLQARFLFPALTRPRYPIEWYVGAGILVVNSFYKDAEHLPSRFYLGKTGLDWILLDRPRTRLALDIGAFAGVRQRSIAYISGAEKKTEESTLPSGGAQLSLRWDFR